MICGSSVEVSGIVFGVVLFVEAFDLPLVFLVAGSVLLLRSEVFALVFLEFVPEDEVLFESDLFFDLSDFELLDLVFRALCCC